MGVPNWGHPDRISCDTADGASWAYRRHDRHPDWHHPSSFARLGLAVSFFGRRNRNAFCVYVFWWLNPVFRSCVSNCFGHWRNYCRYRGLFRFGLHKWTWRMWHGQILTKINRGHNDLHAHHFHHRFYLASRVGNLI